MPTQTIDLMNPVPPTADSPKVEPLVATTGTTSKPIMIQPRAESIKEHVLPLKNQAALIGYYCAIFCIIPVLGLLMGPVAIGYGLVGMERSRSLTRSIGYGHGLFAVVLGIIGTVLNYSGVVAVVVYLLGQYMLNLPPFEGPPLPPPAKDMM